MTSTANNEDTTSIYTDPKVQKWFELVIMKNEYYDFLDDLALDEKPQTEKGE